MACRIGLLPATEGRSPESHAMPRPKGHRLSEESKARISAGKKRGWLKWRLDTAAGKNPPSYGGRPPDSKGNDWHKPTIRRTEHARTPDEQLAMRDALQNGTSIVSAKSLRHPTFVFKLPNGEIRVDYLDERTETAWPKRNEKPDEKRHQPNPTRTPHQHSQS